MSVDMTFSWSHSYPQIIIFPLSETLGKLWLGDQTRPDRENFPLYNRFFYDIRYQHFSFRSDIFDVFSTEVWLWRGNCEACVAVSRRELVFGQIVRVLRKLVFFVGRWWWDEEKISSHHFLLLRRRRSPSVGFVETIKNDVVSISSQDEWYFSLRTVLHDRSSQHNGSSHPQSQ